MSKTDQVYRTLYERIVGGQLSPGFRLVIDSLARDMGVSTMPVREAVRRLEAEGLVRYRPNVGAEVAGIDAHQFAEMHEVLAHLEGLTCEQAVAHVKPIHCEALTGFAHRMQAALDARRMETFVGLEGECHQFLHSLADNRFLGDLAGRLWNRVAPRYLGIYVQVPDSASHSLQDHYQLVQALKEGAPSKLVSHVMEDHMLALLDAFQRRPPSGHLNSSQPLIEGG